DEAGVMEPALGAGVRRVPAAGELEIPTVATWRRPGGTAWDARTLPLPYRWAPSSSLASLGVVGRMLGVGEGARSRAFSQSCSSGVATSSAGRNFSGKAINAAEAALLLSWGND